MRQATEAPGKKPHCFPFGKFEDPSYLKLKSAKYLSLNP